LAIRRKALPHEHPDLAQSLNNLGGVLEDLREYAVARKSIEEALAIRRKALPPEHPDIASSLFNLGMIGLFSGVDLGESVPRFAEAADLLLAEQRRRAVAQTEQEQLVYAKYCYGFVTYLLTAGISSKADPNSVYDRLVRVKGSVTTQQRLSHQLRDTADPDTALLLDQLRQLNQQLLGSAVADRSEARSHGQADAVQVLHSLSAQRADLERQLSQRSPAYRAFQAQARLGADEVRAALPRDSALIDFADYLHVSPPTEGQKDYPVERRLVAFVVRPERRGVSMVPLGPSKPLVDLVDRWRASYGAGKLPAAGSPDPGAELRKQLWEPLQQHLAGAKVVLVSPDGPVHGLPWAALPGSQAGRFLLHEYAFATVPVPQLLPQLLRDRPQPAPEQPTLLLAGGIDFGTAKSSDAEKRPGKLPPVPFFKPLPGTESEVNDLEARFRRAFPQAPAPQVLTENQATKQAVLSAAPKHRYVHLATHGFFADASVKSAWAPDQRAELLRGEAWLHREATGSHPGLLSGVVLAGVNQPEQRPEEAILTALEVGELGLENVELVVLSACETGRGRVAGGEGVLGLQRSFQVAGARSVVASLWAVPDEETHQLMREFYRRVWSGKAASKAESLRQAQLWMLDNWKPRTGLERAGPEGAPSPYVWAAFVLSGDWR
jgi:CHAT domain-containing protein